MKVTTDSCLFGAWAANQLQGLSKDQHLLDIGSGSGLLSLMMAQQTTASIEGIEIQQSDFEQSLENVAASPYSEKVNIHHGNILSFPSEKKFDAIISNPPFYANDLKGNDSGKNIAHHNEGLELPDLIYAIKNLLQPDGHCFLLLPARRLGDIKNLLTENGFHISQLIFVHQTEKHEAFRIMIKAGFENSKTVNSTIYIKNNNQYTVEFTALLKPYYLYL